MSISSLDWAFKQPIGKSSLKFVLVALANYAGPNGECWPSIPRLSLDTGQNEKTVRANLRELAKQNYITDTGRKVGRTKQIPIFLIGNYAAAIPNPTKNGSLSGKGYQKRIRTLPKTDLEPYQKRYPDPSIDPFTEPKALAEERTSQEQRARNAERIANLVESMRPR